MVESLRTYKKYYPTLDFRESVLYTEQALIFLTPPLGKPEASQGGEKAKPRNDKSHAPWISFDYFLYSNFHLNNPRRPIAREHCPDAAE